MIVFMQGCTLPALLRLECEDETQKSPWGYSTQQNGSTLPEYFVIGQPKSDSRRGDSGNNNTPGSEMDISQAGTLNMQKPADPFCSCSCKITTYSRF